LSDLTGIIPAITGKIELVYEGELEGAANVAHTLIGKAIKKLYPRYLPDPGKAKKQKSENPYLRVIEWFTEGNTLDISDQLSTAQYKKELLKVDGLEELISNLHPKATEGLHYLLMELTLHGLAEYSQLSKKYLES